MDIVLVILVAGLYFVMGAGVYRLASKSTNPLDLPLGLLVIVWPVILIFEAFE